MAAKPWWTAIAGSIRSNPTALATVLVIAMAALLRIVTNDVGSFSRADETVYLGQAKYAAANGWGSFSGLVTAYVSDPAKWPFPTPRWSFLAIVGPACAVAGEHCSFRTLAWVSTASGILCLLLVWALARDLFGTRPALVAVALAATSVAHLAMGRRALQDEFVAAVTLLAIWATVRMLQRPHRGWLTTLAAVMAMTVAFGAKDNVFLYLPGLALLILAFWKGSGVRLSDLLVLVVPPALHVLVYTVLGGGLPTLLGVVRIVLMQSSAYDYIRQYQSGPPHQVLLDLLLVSPVVVLIAIIAIERLITWPPAPGYVSRGFAAMTVAVLVAFALFPKDLRYLLVVDALLRIGAATLLAGWWARGQVGRAAVGGLLVANAASELVLYQIVFVTGAVYDPVLVNVLRALNAIPR